MAQTTFIYVSTDIGGSALVNVERVSAMESDYRTGKVTIWADNKPITTTHSLHEIKDMIANATH